MWDTLEAQYGVSDANNELYIMEQFCDYRMVEDRSVVEYIRHYVGSSQRRHHHRSRGF